MNINKLLFEVSLLDKMSGPAKGLMKTMDTVTHRVQSGFTKMGVGVAGLAGAGYTLDRLTGQAKAMHSALGEVASLDVADNVLKQLNKTALKFSVQYGESATDFVSASYDIQSAIDGLVGNELPAFTEASAILAKGTKADTATITGYVGTLYNIFQQNAEAMGKAEWVNMLAGQTATAVKMFKTTGSEMSSAFSTLGAEGQSMGISMNEQIAILGTLQATMSGSEAGTKYKSFLAGVGKAQKKLGLQFTDSQGRMLPMVEILEKIRGKFGAIDTVAESDLLQKAFGRKEAVSLVKLLSANLDGLGASIDKIGSQTGIQSAVDMANTIADPWDKATRAGEALTIMLGQRMLPLLNPLFDGIVSGSEKLMRWIDLFPDIAKWVGIGTLAIIGITAVFAALSLAAGIGTMVMTGFGLVMAVITSPITGIVVGIAAIAYGMYKLLDAAGVFELFSNGWMLIKQGAIDLKNWFNNFSLLDFIMEQLDWLIGKLNLIPGINIDMGGAPKPIAAGAAAGPKLNTPKGGIMQQFSQMNQRNSNVGGVTVNNYGQPMNGQQLLEEIAFAGG